WGLGLALGDCHINSRAGQTGFESPLFCCRHFFLELFLVTEYGSFRICDCNRSVPSKETFRWRWGRAGAATTLRKSQRCKDATALLWNSRVSGPEMPGGSSAGGAELQSWTSGPP